MTEKDRGDNATERRIAQNTTSAERFGAKPREAPPKAKAKDSRKPPGGKTEKSSQQTKDADSGDKAE